MKQQKILKIAIPRPLTTLFDYKAPSGVDPLSIPIGVRVRIPFGKSTVIGFVIATGESEVPQSKLKAITEIIDEEPLFPSDCWHFLRKAQEYYHHSLGEVLITGLPTALREGKPLDKDNSLVQSCFVEGLALLPEHQLNEDQKVATDSILSTKNEHKTFLLEGVTGSGKTEIYLQVLQDLQSRGLAGLVLLPEISLTPQTLARFKQRLKGQIFVYHSKLTPKARLNVWTHVKNHANAIVIGTRSALFLPFTKLGAIIVDEEHDASFKQQEGFRYWARDLAVLRGNIGKCPVILGSATPSFESLHNAQIEKYNHILLKSRANQEKPPQIDLIDVRHKKLQGGLSAALIDKIKNHIKNDNQVLIFLNRRGYAPTYMCYECGECAQCNRCDAKLIVHQARKVLICHHCDKTYPKLDTCPACGKDMHPVGIGTEKLEETLDEIFPEITKVRIDSDTTRKKGELEEKLEIVKSGQAQILIGTQLLAKGHHFPNLTLVAIVDVDGGLFSSDFRAVEKMGQLITQVAGRAGRASKQGQVVLQTCHPENPLLQNLITQGYNRFANNLLIERQHAAMPPFAHLAIIRAQAKSEQKPQQFLLALKEALAAQGSSVDIWGPISAIMAKKQGYHRFALMLQAPNRRPLHLLLAKLNQIAMENPFKSHVRWSLDVDPLEMR